MTFFFCDIPVIHAASTSKAFILGDVMLLEGLSFSCFFFCIITNSKSKKAQILMG